MSAQVPTGKPGERAARIFPRRRPQHLRLAEAQEPHSQGAGTRRSAGGAPGQADPHWRSSPPGNAGGRREGGRRRRRAEQEGGEEGREVRRPLSHTYQSRGRSNIPAVHPGGGRAGPQRSRCSISPTSASERGSLLSAALAWNSAQPLQLLPWASARIQSREIRMAHGPYHIQGETARGVEGSCGQVKEQRFV